MELRQLDPGSEADIQLGARLFCSAPQYMLDTFGRLPREADGRGFVTHVPADTPPQDVLKFVALLSGVGIGLIQVQRRYIHPHRANIGLLLVHPAQQRLGCGSAMLRALSDLVLGWGDTTHFAVSVLDSNAAALAFWRKAGFRTLVSGFNEPGYTQGLTVMERRVAATPIPSATAAAEGLMAGLHTRGLSARR